MRKVYLILLSIFCIFFNCQEKSNKAIEKMDGVFLSLYPEMSKEEFDSATIIEKKKGVLYGDIRKNSASGFSLSIDSQTELNFQIKKELKSIRLYTSLNKIYEPKKIIDSLLYLYKTKYDNEGTLTLPNYSYIDNHDNNYVYNDTVIDYKKNLPFKTVQLSSYGFHKSRYYFFGNNEVTALIGWNIDQASRDLGDMLNAKNSYKYKDGMMAIEIDVDYFRTSSFDSLIKNINMHFQKSKSNYESSLRDKKLRIKHFDSIAQSNRSHI